MHAVAAPTSEQTNFQKVISFDHFVQHHYLFFLVGNGIAHWVPSGQVDFSMVSQRPIKNTKIQRQIELFLQNASKRLNLVDIFSTLKLH